VPAPHADPTAVANATFAAGAPEVWAHRLDFANLPGYNPDVSDVVRVAEGRGVGGPSGVGARYRFQLADSHRPGRSSPVELWVVDAVEPTLVSAGMRGGNEAYEEFAVSALAAGGCRVTLTLWLTLPEGLPPETVEAARASSLAQIDKELVLMKEVLDDRSPGPPEADQSV
jgi:hypothetical protein